MTRTRAPWWLIVAAAAFLSYYALLSYCDLTRPEDVGLAAAFISGQMEVRALAEGSPAERAGLQLGDRILSAAGLPLVNRQEWMIVEWNVQHGQPISLEIDRGGRRVTADLVLQRAPREHWLTQSGIALLIVRGSQLVSLGFALIIALRRPNDASALIAAWLLATTGIFSVVLPSRTAAVWRQLPDAVGLALWLPHVSSLVAAPLLFSFFAMFPRPLIRSAPAWAAVWLPMLPALVGPLSHASRAVYTPQAPAALAYRPVLFFAVSAGYVLAGLMALTTAYRGLTGNTERRRWRVVVAGSVMGLLSGLVVVLAFWFRPQGGLGLFNSPALALGTVLFLAFPLSLVHAILRHRLLDVKLIIRQGLQYALARRLVLSAVPVLIGLLGLDLFVHRDQPLSAVLEQRGWMYVSLAAVALASHTRRQQWLDRLDRRFFRERYDANRLLRDVIEDVRQAADVAVIAPHVVAQIEAALHPRFVALLMHEPDRDRYSSLAVSPSAFPVQAMPATLKVPELVRVLGKPLELPLADSGWLRRQLPDDEAEWLKRSGIDLLAPVATSADGRETLVALGAKRSEEPYSQEDLDLLAAIASSLGLLIDRSRPPVAAMASQVEECPACGACYDAGTGRCADDRTLLQPASLPRMLAGRYRIERRLGRGGMASVYAALDTALDREVAVKVMRDDLLESPQARERFRREARIVANFTHPNVVTVYDFGLTERRAFLVMELLKGRTLREELTQQARLASPRVIAILRGVCAAVEAAHRRGFIHRDLKPENIFLACDDAEEKAKILDFGIAKALLDQNAVTRSTGETGVGVLLGTPPYMAPEQLRGENPSPAWDIWALGVVAYEMLTGAHPFATRTGSGWHDMALVGHQTAIETRLGDAPLSWRPFFMHALAVEAARRPDSARRLFSELEQALNQ